MRCALTTILDDEFDVNKKICTSALMNMSKIINSGNGIPLKHRDLSVMSIGTKQEISWPRSVCIGSLSRS